MKVINRRRFKHAIYKYITTRRDRQRERERERERELEGKSENQRSVKGSKNSWIIHQMLN